jgi:cytochrome c
MNFRSLAFAVSALAALSTHAQAQDADAGKLSFNKCRPCHQIGENARNLVGPELNGVIGRKAGSVEGFNYSDANKDSGITWDEPTFKEYIANPRAKVPGTKMAFAGIKNEAEVNNLLAYLKTFAPDGKTK